MKISLDKIAKKNECSTSMKRPWEKVVQLEESSGVIPSNWASKLSGLFKKN